MQLQFDIAGASPLEPVPIQLNRIGALDSRLVAFSDDEPASTSPENALTGARRRLLIRAPEADVRAVIADVTCAERKAPCLQAALHTIQSQRGVLTLDFLAGFSGDIALVWQRLGWIPPGIKTAEKACQPLMALVPSMWDPDDLYGMHWP